ncbi:MAG: hypothetical protein LBU70_06390 [Chitinispirillales bacterium]|jgi:hypothetical protein|nr:hypothetical protein [Chitinispirillales bacterium]
MNIFRALINRILFRKTRANRYFKKLNSIFETHNSGIDSIAAGALLTVLLNLMKFVLFIDPVYRLNIKKFDAKYVFKDKSGKLYVTAEFKSNKLRVGRKQIRDPEFTLIFKDGKTLISMLFSESLDILDSILNQDVNFEGNINYLNKFAYMAVRLKLMATGKVPKK